MTKKFMTFGSGPPTSENNVGQIPTGNRNLRSSLNSHTAFQLSRYMTPPTCISSKQSLTNEDQNHE